MTLLSKPILLATVPHTGTKFFMKIIEESLGVKHYHMRGQILYKDKPQPLHRHDLVLAHLSPPNWQPIKDYISLYKPVLITTERDYKKVVLSHEKRGKNDGRVEINYRVSDQFRKKYDPLILSVDSDDREERLILLSELIGQPLHTDWLPVGTYGV